VSRKFSILLTVLAALITVVTLAEGERLEAIPPAACVVLFGLESLGVTMLGRTARLLRARRRKSSDQV
jgi:hypothetical protein